MEKEQMGVNPLYAISKGIENNAQHFLMGDGSTLEEAVKIQAKNKFNEQVDEYVQKFDDYSNDIEQQAKRITENMNDLEIVPYGTRLLIRPFAQNPYQKIKTTESGLIVDLGGMAPTYKSNETGQFEEEEQGIIVGQVIEAGPDCRYAKAGDHVFYLVASAAPIPFFRQGFVTIAENQVLVFVNEGLTERFKQSTTFDGTRDIVRNK